MVSIEASTPPTACGLIVGDELLKGTWPDTNGQELVRVLRRQGLCLRRLTLLPDDEEAIAEEIRTWRPKVTWLFTSGGVGPTHDDLTYAAVARALGRPLVESPELVEVLEARLDKPLGQSALQMARVPEGSSFWWEGAISYPVVVADNVVMLPGVPKLFRQKLGAIAHRFQGGRPWVAQIGNRAAEVQIGISLKEAAALFPTVAIGSYPRDDIDGFRGLVVLEGMDREAVEACARWLGGRLGAQLGPPRYER